MRSVAELNQAARDIIAEGRHAIKPAPAVRERVRQRVLVQLVATSAGVLATSTSLASLAKLGIAVALASTVVGGAAYWGAVATRSPAVSQSSSIAHQAAPNVANASQSQTGANGAVAATSGLAPAEPANTAGRSSEANTAASSETIATAATTVVTSRSGNGSAPSASARGRELSAEIKLLSQANAALNRGDMGGARQLLATYDQRFGAGQLREERALAQILLLCGTGAVVEAEAARAQFDKRWPRSPLKLRIERSCAGKGR